MPACQHTCVALACTEVVADAIRQKPVSFFTPKGVVTDTEVYQGGTSLHTMPWENILHVDVHKSREVARPPTLFCCFCYDIDHEGLSYSIIVPCCIFLPCFQMLLVEKVVPNYSVVTFYYVDSLQDGKNSTHDLVYTLPTSSEKDVVRWTNKLAKNGVKVLWGADVKE